MAKADAAETETETEAEELEAVTPSELDELTHAEMLELYRNASDQIRFAKHQQWATLVGTLALFVLLGVVGAHAYAGTFLFKLVVLISIVLSVGAIYSLVIYQFWQSAERERLALISARFSNILRAIRGVVSDRERNIHRYVLLFFMVSSIVLGNWLLITYLGPKL